MYTLKLLQPHGLCPCIYVNKVFTQRNEIYYVSSEDLRLDLLLLKIQILQQQKNRKVYPKCYQDLSGLRVHRYETQYGWSYGYRAGYLLAGPLQQLAFSLLWKEM